MGILTAIQTLLFILLIGYAGGYEAGCINDAEMLIRFAIVLGGMIGIHILKLILRRCKG